MQDKDHQEISTYSYDFKIEIENQYLNESRLFNSTTCE
uniref:Uncharacterized protein n=1 Tax=Tetranychus urticae TaxID=32264 RepID=T1JQ41_TETUR